MQALLNYVQPLIPYTRPAWELVRARPLSSASMAYFTGWMIVGALNRRRNIDQRKVELWDDEGGDRPNEEGTASLITSSVFITQAVAWTTLFWFVEPVVVSNLASNPVSTGLFGYTSYRVYSAATGTNDSIRWKEWPFHLALVSAIGLRLAGFAIKHPMLTWLR